MTQKLYPYNQSTVARRDLARTRMSLQVYSVTSAAGLPRRPKGGSHDHAFGRGLLAHVAWAIRRHVPHQRCGHAPLEALCSLRLRRSAPPLVVIPHGGRQGVEDFAVGMRM